MPSAYARALGRLAGLARFGVRPGLEPLDRVLGALGRPERAVPALHVAGTNGKGSTAAFAEAILRAHGRRTGLYTSPHLVRFRERIQVGDEAGRRELDEERVAALIERVMAAPGGATLTFFEVATAAAFLHFAEAGVEVAIIEVGLGGRADATNLCRPFASVITSIGLDHTAELGPTIEAIAVEKAGIARRGVPLLTGPLPAAAERAIADVAGRVGAPRWRWGEELFARGEGARLSYRGPGGALDDAPLSLWGRHQIENAALALAATSFAPGAPRDPERRRRALGATAWPGRLERFDDLILDGAHNPDGAQRLGEALRGLGLVRPTLLVGVLGDKEVDGVVAALAPVAGRVVATRPPSPRALPPAELGRRFQRSAPSLPVAVVEEPHAALVGARGTGTVVACGSLYLVGELRRLLTGEAADPIAVADPLGQVLSTAKT